MTFGNERPVFSLVDSCEIFHVNVQIHAYRSGMVAGVKMCLPALGYNLSMVDNYLIRVCEGFSVYLGSGLGLGVVIVVKCMVAQPW